MIKNIVKLEHKIGERVYHLLCDNDSPISEVKEALAQFLGYAVAIEKAVSESTKSKEEVEQPKEE